MKIQYDPSLPRWLNYARSFVLTNDLDPVYVGVNSAIKAKAISLEEAHNFLAVMSTFYSISEACKVVTLGVDGNKVWNYCLDNYSTMKRGTERRHFRGEQGLRCLNYLKANYESPTDFVQKHHKPTYAEVFKNFEKVPNFGPYHVWKWLDFFDRILGLPVAVDLDFALSVMPSEPVHGAKLVSMEVFGEDRPLKEVISYMLKECHGENIMAPPNHDRLVGVQEIETMLCMIKHCYNGTDHLGKDVRDKYESVKSLGADGAWLLPHMPKPIPRVDFLDPIFTGASLLDFE